VPERRPARQRPQGRAGREKPTAAAVPTAPTLSAPPAPATPSANDQHGAKREGGGGGASCDCAEPHLRAEAHVARLERPLPLVISGLGEIQPPRETYLDTDKPPPCHLNRRIGERVEEARKKLGVIAVAAAQKVL
jgi:hypothetical protein